MDESSAWQSLATSIREIYKLYLDILTKTLGFLLLGIGWLITSDSARHVIGSDDVVRWGAIVVIAVFLVMHSLATGWYVGRIRDKLSLLNEYHVHLDKRYYSEFLIGKRVFLFNWSLSFVLFLVLLVLVLRIPRVPS